MSIERRGSSNFRGAGCFLAGLGRDLPKLPSFSVISTATAKMLSSRERWAESRPRGDALADELV
jgi:hypothetical protein